MKKFIYKFLLYIFLVIFVLLGAMLIMGPQYEQEYTGAVLDKIRRLESIKEPKIILVGNSNLAFGMDSEQIEAAFGMPVVNLGLHGGLGDEFHYNMAKENISSGDIVILTNTHFNRHPLNDIELAWITIESHFNLWPLIAAEDRISMLTAMPKYIKKQARKAFESSEIIEGAYSRARFNEYGDIDYPRNHNLVDFSSITLGVPSVTDEGIALINEMNAFCQERSATCLLAAYPIPYGEYSPAEESFLEMSELLKTNIDCDLISDYRDYFFDYKYFYDSQYHLTTEGTDLRTKQLIKDLQNWMEP